MGAAQVIHVTRRQIAAGVASVAELEASGWVCDFATDDWYATREALTAMAAERHARAMAADRARMRMTFAPAAAERLWGSQSGGAV
jgi:hypothetical protein